MRWKLAVATLAASWGFVAIIVREVDLDAEVLVFYRVLESEAEAFRLGLCRATQLVVARCLDLLGVSAPDRM